MIWFLAAILGYVSWVTYMQHGTLDALLEINKTQNKRIDALRAAMTEGGSNHDPHI